MTRPAAEPLTGHEARRRVDSRLLDTMTALGNAAARRNNEMPAA